MELADGFLASVDERAVHPQPDHDRLVERLGGAMPTDGIGAGDVIEALARDVDEGLVASVGPRYFGFVIGGAHPAAVAADWLVSAWDQNAGGYVLGPSVAVIEDVSARWLLELFGLPRECGVGFTTGCQGANTTALAAARHVVLEKVGWDVERDGLGGSPRVNILVGADAHVTIFRACRLLGFGDAGVRLVAMDDQGRMRVDALAEELGRCDGPTIVCAQAGNVNTGAFDPVGEIADLVHEHSGWVHVDGAFGLWARASGTLAHLADGVERADSWATDAHKQLNVPQDCGVVMVRDREALRNTMRIKAAYIHEGTSGRRDAHEFGPESSRRARGVPVYVMLKMLGTRGVEDLVDRFHRLALRMAERLSEHAGVEILNDVVLNQVLVGLGVDDDETDRVIERVQREGTCWLGGTTWRGKRAMRVSISAWNTSEADIDRSAAAILGALEAQKRETQQVL
jgi:glutamate/tyrosine decarboxylase-like PLP-dependent enzyme